MRYTIEDHKRKSRTSEIMEGDCESVGILVAFQSDAIVDDRHQ